MHKYSPPYRIDTGSIYKLDHTGKSYIYVCSKVQLTKKEYQYYKEAIELYDINYDKQSKGCKKT